MTTGERLAAFGLALPPGHTLVSLEERPDLEEAHDRLNGSVWPEFMLQDQVVDTYWDRLFGDFGGVLSLELGRAPSGANRCVGAVGTRVVADVQVGAELGGGQVKAATDRVVPGGDRQQDDGESGEEPRYLTVEAGL